MSSGHTKGQRSSNGEEKKIARQNKHAPRTPQLLQAAFCVLAVSLTVSSVRVELTPLFGSVATKLHLNQFSSLLVMTLALLPPPSLDRQTKLVILTTILCATPPALHILSILSAKLRNPVVGPCLAYLPILVPVVYLTNDLIRSAVTSLSSGLDVFLLVPSLRGIPWIQEISVLAIMFLPGVDKRNSLRVLNGLSLAFVVSKSQGIFESLAYGRAILQPIALIITAWVIFFLGKVTRSSLSASPGIKVFLSRSALLSLCFPLMVTLIALYLPPTLPQKLPFIHPSGMLRVLESTPSITGKLVVAEDYTNNIRFLRADHSLLGGRWINDRISMHAMVEGQSPLTDEEGVKLGDSIYSAFILQEASRLHQRPSPQRNALFIGLGTGIAVQAFIAHGLETTVVELNPFVYSFARRYFGLPEPNNVFIEDARSWVARYAADTDGERYDIVVHDLFSGGGIPAQLYTSEFWNDLKKIIHPHGIVAVNYAGYITSESSKAVLVTLQKHFGQCRIFHDARSSLTEEQIVSEFINMIFFCSASDLPLQFRPAVQNDYLHSYLREHVLRVFDQREIAVEVIRGNLTSQEEDHLLITDARNPLVAWGDQLALAHWAIMRNVLPDRAWNTY